MGIFLVPVVLVIIILYFIVSRTHRVLRRSKLLNQPLKPGWKEIIEKDIALFHHVPMELRDELYGKTQIIMAEKNWEGCGGLELTEEMKVSVSAQAAILLLNRKTKYFPVVDSILIYPSAYKGKSQSKMGYNVPEEQVRLGESWTQGTVVLAWDHVCQQAGDLSIGRNVVLHEFAHQLDQEDGQGDGTPVLDKWSSYKTWARILGREYTTLREKVMRHQSDVIDAYGATNPAEFFAVATESFFDRSQKMKKSHPELYEEFKEYYKLDPATWF